MIDYAALFPNFSEEKIARLKLCTAVLDQEDLAATDETGEKILVSLQAVADQMSVGSMGLFLYFWVMKHQVTEQDVLVFSTALGDPSTDKTSYRLRKLLYLAAQRIE